MVFYFSGTGNSRWIAERVAKHIGDTAVSIIDQDPRSYSFTKEDFLGIVFPVYAYAAPEIVQNFVSQLNPNGAFTFAICNYSDKAGYTLKQLSDDYLKLDSGYGVLMPDNTSHNEIPFDTEESTMQKLEVAPDIVDGVATRIAAREKGVFDSLIGDNAEYLTYKLSVSFNDSDRKTQPFFIREDACIGCGLCAELCPAKLIEIVDGRPVWTKENCHQCMACFGYCPTEAIERGPFSAGRYRYNFEKYFSKL